MCLMIILKVAKIQDVMISLENTIREKPQGDSNGLPAPLPPTQSFKG